MGKINVIVSTTETQGQRQNDFCFVPEEEPVAFGIVCDSDVDDPDGSCGCSRSLMGFDSKKSSTTFKVVAKEMTKRQYIKMYVDAWRKTGFPVTRATRLDADIMYNAAWRFPVGAVLEYRAGIFSARRWPKS